MIAWLLDGPEARYAVPLPERGEAKTAILGSYTKEHSAEYQAQAWIDLARRLRIRPPRGDGPGQVESIVIHTSHHTHFVIGSGSGDPQKFDPQAPRDPRPLAALHLQRRPPGRLVAPRRLLCAARHPGDTVALWHKVSTGEDPEWTRRYH